MNGPKPRKPVMGDLRQHATFAASILVAALSLAACGSQVGMPAFSVAQAEVHGDAGGSAAPVTHTAIGTATMQGQAVPTSPTVMHQDEHAIAPDAPRVNLAQTINVAPEPANTGPSHAQGEPRAQAQDEVVRSRSAVPTRVTPVANAHLGEVRSIEPIRSRPEGNGTGAVIGGVLGAVVGNQFGHGGGRAVTTVLGAAGGAVAGNNVERNHREGIVGYLVSVRLDNGTVRTFRATDASKFRVGDRVRVDRGRINLFD